MLETENDQQGESWRMLAHGSTSGTCRFAGAKAAASQGCRVVLLYVAAVFAKREWALHDVAEFPKLVSQNTKTNDPRDQ